MSIWGVPSSCWGAGHEVEHHLVNLLGATVGFVDLIHHYDGFQTDLKGLLKHKACLGHRALEGIDEQQAAVGHIEHTLYLATEVGVARSVDDIDFRTFPIDGNIL